MDSHRDVFIAEHLRHMKRGLSLRAAVADGMRPALSTCVLVERAATAGMEVACWRYGTYPGCALDVDGCKDFGLHRHYWTIILAGKPSFELRRELELNEFFPTDVIDGVPTSWEHDVA